MKTLKTFFAALLISFIVPVLNAQCNLSVNFSDTTIDCGNPIEIGASGFSSGTPLLATDFNGGSFGPGWLTTPTLTYTNPCGPSLDGTPSGWVGSSAGVRSMVTNAMDLSCGAQVCFDLDFASDDACGGCPDCEDPDLFDEGVFFSYSIDAGATWVDIFYFDANSANTTPYYQWDNYCFILPPGALTPATMLKWEQPMVSSSINDHWGIDNIFVTPSNCNYWYDWAHIPGFPDNPSQIVAPGDTATYYVTYTDGITSCLDSVVVNVLPLQIDILATMDTIDCGACADLSVDFLSGSSGSIVDDFDPDINSTVWGDIQNGTISTICGGGATGNALYFDGAGSFRYAETIAIDATACATIDFCLYMGNVSSGGNPCENNENGEDVVLEYSIDAGASFIPISTFAQSLWDGANYQQCFSEVIPAAAQTSSTIFRWRQVAFSGFVGSDNWSLDDVDVSCFPVSISYNWSGAVNDPLSPLPTACPTATEQYTVSVLNSVNGCNAADTMTLFVNQCTCSFIQFDASIVTLPGGMIDINGSFQFSNSPTTGTLEVEATNATGTYTQTFNAPFTDSLLYDFSITGITNDGSNVLLSIYFSDSLSCNESLDLAIPTNCLFMQFDAGITSSGGGLIDVGGSFQYSTSPTSGTLQVVAGNGTGAYTQTFMPPFTDSLVYNFAITGIQNDSSDVIVVIFFSDSLGCTDTIVLSPVVSIQMIDQEDESCIFSPNPVNDEAQLVFNNEQQAEVRLTIVNLKGQLIFESTSSEESITIDANHFMEGMYFFRLETNDSRNYCSGKFAVTH